MEKMEGKLAKHMCSSVAVRTLRRRWNVTSSESIIGETHNCNYVHKMYCNDWCNIIPCRYIEIFNSSASDIKPVVPKVVPPMMRSAPYERPRGDYGGYGGYGGYTGFRGRQSGYERQYRGNMHGFGDYPMGPPRPGGLISYPQVRPAKVGGGGLLPGMMGLNNHEVRMRGLPYSATQNDIKNFFSPLVPQSVEIMFDDYGRPTGEAMVGFVSHEDAVAAMKKDRENMRKQIRLVTENIDMVFRA